MIGLRIALGVIAAVLTVYWSTCATARWWHARCVARMWQKRRDDLRASRIGSGGGRRS